MSISDLASNVSIGTVSLLSSPDDSVKESTDFQSD